MQHDFEVFDDVLLSDRMVAMRMQEKTSYLCPDYLLHVRENKCRDWESHDEEEDGDEEFEMQVRREKICEWIFQVVDQCDMSREIAEVSMSFLDRFLASLVLNSSDRPSAPLKDGSSKRQRKGQSSAVSTVGSISTGCTEEESYPVSGFVFQLASLTALYLAIKLYDHRRIRIDRLAQLSRGHFTPADIASMERTMLPALRWKTHPPTSMDFLRSFSEFLPPPSAHGISSDLSVNADIFELARFFSELSVWECSFIPEDASTVALAAISNSFDMIGKDRFPPTARQEFFDNLGRAAPGLFRPEGPAVKIVKERLSDIFTQSAECSPDGVHEKFLSGLSAVTVEKTVPSEADREVPSPVCVSRINV